MNREKNLIVKEMIFLIKKCFLMTLEFKRNNISYQTNYHIKQILILEELNLNNINQ